MKTGLVLEGGAMRGMYTAGVLDTFLDENIGFDCIVGVSAGALFGVNFLSRQKGRVIRYNKRFNGDKNYMGIIPLIKEGNIFSTKYAYEDVPRRLDPFDDDTYKSCNVPFYAVLTDVQSGQPEYVRIDSVFEQMDTLRASGSMPIVSRPVEIGGRLYLDGGISDSIPYKWLYEQGCDRLVVVLTRHIEYRKKPASSAVVGLCGLKYPKIAERMKSRHEDYNSSAEHLRELEREGKAFVIRPTEEIKISRLEKNPEKLQFVYELGIKDCKASLNELKSFCQM